MPRCNGVYVRSASSIHLVPLLARTQYASEQNLRWTWGCPMILGLEWPARSYSFPEFCPIVNQPVAPYDQHRLAVARGLVHLLQPREQAVRGNKEVAKWLDTVTSQERPLNIQAMRFTREPTRAGSWTNTRGKGLKLAAPARLHPCELVFRVLLVEQHG
jgi:hypothetical protein